MDIRIANLQAGDDAALLKVDNSSVCYTSDGKLLVNPTAPAGREGHVWVTRINDSEYALTINETDQPLEQIHQASPAELTGWLPIHKILTLFGIGRGPAITHYTYKAGVLGTLLLELWDAPPALCWYTDSQNVRFNPANGRYETHLTPANFQVYSMPTHANDVIIKRSSGAMNHFEIGIGSKLVGLMNPHW